jgi:Acetyltransferase (GNAT) domain
MSPSDLVRLGSVKSIQLRLESYGNLSPEFSFRAIICKYAATPPPSILDVSTLPPGIDVILFPACPLERELPKLSLGWHCFRYTRPWTNFIVQLHGTFEDYWNGFCSKTRWTVKRKEQKLAEAFGPIQYRQYRSRDEMAEFYSIARRVKLDEFSRRALGNAVPEGRSFYGDMLERASLDQVRGYVMMLNGEPVSYLYCIVSDDALLHELPGYDSEFARFSPSVLLQRYALEQLFAERTFAWNPARVGLPAGPQRDGRLELCVNPIFSNWLLQS